MPSESALNGAGRCQSLSLPWHTLSTQSTHLSPYPSRRGGGGRSTAAPLGMIVRREAVLLVSPSSAPYGTVHSLRHETSPYTAQSESRTFQKPFSLVLGVPNE